MPARQFCRGLQRLIDVAHVVMLFEPASQAMQNLHSLLNRGFDDIDLLEAARQGPVLLEDAAEFGVGG